METIQLNFIPSDFEGDYINIEDCPVARAICRTLHIEPKDIGVGCTDINFYKSILTTNAFYFGFVKLNQKEIESGQFGVDSYDSIKEAIENGTFKSASVEITSNDPFFD